MESVKSTLSLLVDIAQLEEGAAAKPQHDGNNPDLVVFAPGVGLKTLRFRDEDVTGSIDGYVGTEQGSLRYTTAFLAPTLEANIVSLAEARRLDLDVREPESMLETVYFDFGTRRPGKSVGTATLQWNAGPQEDGRFPPLSIVCDVCENATVKLILGKPFLEEKARRWRRRGGVSP
ncbi:e923e9ae-460d-443c-a31e-1c381a4e674a [Thermothielavioides terrestris]|uniref:E923e9ae-460d-443c-a31e-1c381a4e674a n=1 Tax=Thermothielavioides terrestris TaxID=2587410 RepID=A0A3S4AML2_9PEZI|nr:e923e9ae-460d-443c-a31e-1c381a4e674a [Thermothielavioides terrestris]